MTNIDNLDDFEYDEEIIDDEDPDDEPDNWNDYNRENKYLWDNPDDWDA